MKKNIRKHYTEYIGVGDNGHLWVEDCDCVELANTFGTPLYVVSENQFRHNYRAFYQAFASRYPEVEVLYANKANNNIAIRHIMNQEGAGGDCFGVGELYLSLLAGTNPKKLVLNGSNKSPEEIEMALHAGVCINLDALDELDMVEASAQRLDKDADVGIRVKLELKPLENAMGTSLHGKGSLAQQERSHKWGMPLAQAISMAERIQTMDRLKLQEINFHLGRLSHDPGHFAEMAREMVQWLAHLREATGVTLRYLDLGGGWAVGRPEKLGPMGEDDETTPSFEEYAKMAVTAIRDECAKQNLPLPVLRIEPGRAIAATAVILIGRVGAVKEWPGFKKWVNVDCSTNHVIRIETSNWYHHIVSVNKADADCTDTVDVVGPLCSLDQLGADRKLPPLVRGDLIALLDTGAYAETASSNFNAQPGRQRC